ncbi:MAG: hypothetical protein QXO71_00860 [Candidatus Jordarchaeaceae archaeon]
MQEAYPQRFVISDIKVIGTWDFTKLSRCTVCNLEIKEENRKVHCPFCGLPAHRDHLLEWLKIKGFCPNCAKPLDIKEVRKW